jgi:hypothetical protein
MLEWIEVSFLTSDTEWDGDGGAAEWSKACIRLNLKRFSIDLDGVTILLKLFVPVVEQCTSLRELEITCM